MDSDLLKACITAKSAVTQRRGMIVSQGRWSEIVGHAQYVGPRTDWLMEFCGLKVAVCAEMPDHFIVWTDEQGNPIGVQDLRNQTEK